MMKATGKFAEPVEALEFSRYLVEDLPAQFLCIRRVQLRHVSRTIEGVRLAREKGAWTLAVTVSADNSSHRLSKL